MYGHHLTVNAADSLNSRHMVHAQALSVGACGNPIPRLTCPMSSQCQAKPGSTVNISVNAEQYSSVPVVSQQFQYVQQVQQVEKMLRVKERGHEQRDEQTKTSCTASCKHVAKVSLLEGASFGLFSSVASAFVIDDQSGLD